MDQEDLKANL